MADWGIILYGPPGSGKDAITNALVEQDDRCRLFQKLKLGGGRYHGYRFTTDTALARLRAAGMVIYENTRYGNTYAIDRPELERLLHHEHMPVVHVGQTAGLQAVQGFPLHWLRVLLWCPREVATRRLEGRSCGLLPERLRVWDETKAELKHAKPCFDLCIETDMATPSDIALDLRKSLPDPA